MVDKGIKITLYDTLINVSLRRLYDYILHNVNRRVYYSMPPNAPTLFKSRKEGRGSTVSFESLIIVLVDILLPENQQVAYNFKFYHILVVCLLSAGSTVVSDALQR